MLFLLSPAKTLNYDTRAPAALPYTEPQLLDQSRILIDALRQKTPQEIETLMSISPKLAQLNVQRYHDWSLQFTPQNAKQSALTFNGDLYEGLDAASLPESSLDWAQSHVLILSGLYGALRPLDLLQAYRLEMGTRLPVGSAANLYAFWKNTLTPFLNQRLAQQKTPVVVKLASTEYFKAVDLKQLKARVIDCVFQDEKNGQYKIISFYAKFARGLMARYAIENQLEHPEQLKNFDLHGYRFEPELSDEGSFVFRRSEADVPNAR